MKVDIKYHSRAFFSLLLIERFLIKIAYKAICRQFARICIAILENARAKNSDNKKYTRI